MGKRGEALVTDGVVVEHELHQVGQVGQRRGEMRRAHVADVVRAQLEPLKCWHRTGREHLGEAAHG